MKVQVRFVLGISFFCLFNLSKASNDNLIFKSTAPFLSRPIYTNPSMQNQFNDGSWLSANLIVGTTLPFLERNKSIFDTTIRREAAKELYDLSQDTVLSEGYGLLMPENRKIVSKAFSDLLDISGKLTAEHHRVGVVLGANFTLNGGDSQKDHYDCMSISMSLPIVFRIGHFYILSDDLAKMKDLFKKIVDVVREEYGDLGSGLSMFDKLKSDLLSSAISKKFGLEEVKLDLFSPVYRGKFGLEVRVGFESIIDLDFSKDKGSENIGINRNQLYEFKTTGNNIDDWESLFRRLMNEQKMDMLSMNDIIYALANSRIKPQLDGWGNALGIVVDASFHLIPDKIKLFSRFRNDLFFGQTKKAVVIIDDFLEPSEIVVQTSPSLLSQINLGADICFERWDFKVGYDFLIKTSGAIDFLYDSYRDPRFISIQPNDGPSVYEYRGGLDYQAIGHAQTKLAQAPDVWQHRIYFVASRELGYNKDFIFNFGSDIALASKFMPRNLNFSIGFGYKF